MQQWNKTTVVQIYILIAKVLMFTMSACIYRLIDEDRLKIEIDETITL
jgi:hypothetical protein